MLRLRDYIKINCKLGEPYRFGNTDKGYFKIIPITDGNFTGELSGKVLKFGGDFNYKFNDKRSTANARYILRTDDNYLIYIQNSGKIDKNHNMITHPTFITDQTGPYNFLNYKNFIGIIIPQNKNTITISIKEIV